MKQKYDDIEYNLKRSNRKTMSLYIERDGSISILAPKDLEIDEIEKLIESKKYWIYKSLEEWALLNKSKQKRDFVNGEGFLYMGRSYRLNLVENQDKSLKLYKGYFCLDKSYINNAYGIFKEFYREKASEKIKERVEYYKNKIGVNPNEIRVMELKNRWASCSDKGNLNFHWKCIMAPLTIIDYIIVHELVHLIYPNHTDAFWNEVDKVLPDYKGHKDWLKIKGANLDI